MQNAIWKFTALTGVIGIGFLVVLQVQRGLIRQRDGNAAEVEAEFQFPDFENSPPDGAAPSSAATGSDFSLADLGPQNEPTVGSDETRSKYERRRTPDLPPFGGSDTEQTEPDIDDVAHSNPGFDAPDSGNLNGFARTASTSDSPFRPFPGTETEEPEESPLDDSMGGPAISGNEVSDPFLVTNEPEEPAEEAPDEQDPSSEFAAAPLIVDDPFTPKASPPVAKPAATGGPQLVIPDEETPSAGDEDHSDELSEAPADPFARHNSEFDPANAIPSVSQDNPFNTPSPFGQSEDHPAADAAAAAEPEPEPSSDDPGERPRRKRRPGSDRDGDAFPERGSRPVKEPKVETDADVDEPTPSDLDDDSSDGPSFGAQAQPERRRAKPEVTETEIKTPTVSESPAPLGLHVPMPASAIESSAPPMRLDPAPSAAPLERVVREEAPATMLKGMGTVSADAPQGAQRHQLHLEKLAPPSAVLGVPMVYMIVVRNGGGCAAHEVVVEDQIPKGTRLTGTIPQAELSEDRLVWRIGTLQAGQELRIKVRVIPESEGSIGSVATVNFNSEVASRTLVSAPKLQLELTSPLSECGVGDPVPFRFRLQNKGSGKATGVVIRNVIPDGLQHPSGNNLEYEIGTLGPGDSREVNLTLKAVQPGQMVNEAMVVADGGLEVKADATVDVASWSFKIDRTGPSLRTLGSRSTFVNTIKNDSTRAVSGATVVEHLAAGMKFIEASDGGQYDPARRTVAWRLDRLDANQSKELKVTLSPLAMGPQKSAVAIYDSAGKLREQVASEITVTGFSSLVVSVADVPSPVATGDRITYFVRVRNRGTAEARNVQLKVGIPSQLELMAAQGPSQYKAADDGIRFSPVASLRAGSEEIFKMEFRAKEEGDARLLIQVDDDQMERALNREEAILIYADRLPAGSSGPQGIVTGGYSR